MPSLRNLKDNRTVRTAVLVLLATLAAVSVFQGIRNALAFSQDFQWDAAKALAMGIDPYELSMNPENAKVYPELEKFYRMFTDRGLTQKMEANQFPSLLVLLFPMTFFPPEAAKVVWCILNLAFTAGIIVLLRKTFFEKTDTYTFAALMLVMLSGTPYRNQLGVGQHTLFAFFFFMLAVYFDKRSRSGQLKDCIIIAFCLFVSYFKYTLTAPLVLYFVYRKRYREIVISVCAHAALTVGAAFMLGRSVIYMIKAPLTVASALVAEGGIDLGVLLKGTGAYAAAFVIAAALTVITVLLPKGRENILFAVLILWSLVLTYHRTYDFFVLSAATAMFGSGFAEDYGERRDSVYKVWLGLLTVFIYFVLRLFNENTPSKICAAVLYYGFTLAATYLLIRLIKRKNNV